MDCHHQQNEKKEKRTNYTKEKLDSPLPFFLKNEMISVLRSEMSSIKESNIPNGILSRMLPLSEMNWYTIIK